MCSNNKWICIAWEGKGSNPNKENFVSANHRMHAEMKLLEQLQLKGI